LAWSGGEFRLFIANIRYGARHPYLWLYGAFLTIAMVGPRWWSVTAPTVTLLAVAALYWAMVMWLHWKHRNRWIILMPLYSLVNSLILTPIGVVWYFVMAVPEKNFGVIRPKFAQSEAPAPAAQNSRL
jgi:heme/copper-type cytochrome/quinol oxidase subunit 4